ncbi:MAG: DUF3471 domain-containing protein [Pirellulaceae bacterium]
MKLQIEFVKDDDGNVVKGVHSQGGRTFDVAKIEVKAAIELPQEKLAEYEGNYSYGLLSGKMKVTVEDGKLMAQLRGQPKLELVATAEDEFRWKDVNASITFERDDEGQVVRGVHTQGGRTFKVPKVK